MANHSFRTAGNIHKIFQPTGDDEIGGESVGKMGKLRRPMPLPFMDSNAFMGSFEVVGGSKGMRVVSHRLLFKCAFQPGRLDSRVRIC